MVIWSELTQGRELQCAGSEDQNATLRHISTAVFIHCCGSQIAAVVILITAVTVVSWSTVFNKASVGNRYRCGEEMRSLVGVGDLRW